MKTEIENLIKLANKFWELGEQMELGKGWNYFKNLSIYFANQYETKSITFDYDKIEISTIGKKILIPFNCTIEYLQETYIKYSELYEKMKADFESNSETVIEDERQRKIEKLEKELQILKQKTV